MNSICKLVCSIKFIYDLKKHFGLKFDHWWLMTLQPGLKYVTGSVNICIIMYIYLMFVLLVIFHNSQQNNNLNICI